MSGKKQENMQYIKYCWNKYCLRPIDPGNAIVEIAAMTSIAEDKFGGDHISYVVRLCTYLHWYEKRKDIFWVIVTGGAIVGYIAMLPLKDDRHFKGTIGEFQISNDMISDGPSKFVLLLGVHIKYEHLVDADGLATFVNGFYKIGASHMYKVGKLMMESRIYTEPVIDANEIIYIDLGFILCKQKNEGNKRFFEIYFGETSEARKNKCWKDATRKMWNYRFGIGQR